MVRLNASTKAMIVHSLKTPLKDIRYVALFELFSFNFKWKILFEINIKIFKILELFKKIFNLIYDIYLI